MVVVDPQDARATLLLEGTGGVGEELVGRLVGLPPNAVDDGLVDEIVEQGPQGLVREPVIVGSDESWAE